MIKNNLFRWEQNKIKYLVEEEWWRDFFHLAPHIQLVLEHSNYLHIPNFDIGEIQENINDLIEQLEDMVIHCRNLTSVFQLITDFL